MVERGVAVVIEDDDDVRTALKHVLQQSGFAVLETSSGLEGVEAVRKHQPVVVTIDVGLPDFDGIEASRRIRMFSDAYVIIVTGRVEEADALMGFEAGADDYLTKPFRPRELRSRIAAMLRRPRTLKSTTEDRSPSSPTLTEHVHETPAVDGADDTPSPHAAAAVLCDFEHKGLTLHEGSRSAAIQGAALDLTRTQFDLLLFLLDNGRLVQTKADLVRRLRNEPYNTGSFVSAGEERSVEVHLGNLRKRLGDSSRSPRWIETVRGVGYRLAP